MQLVWETTFRGNVIFLEIIVFLGEACGSQCINKTVSFHKAHGIEVKC
jgi:hypothetical protein